MFNRPGSIPLSDKSTVFNQGETQPPDRRLIDVTTVTTRESQFALERALLRMLTKGD